MGRLDAGFYENQTLTAILVVLKDYLLPRSLTIRLAKSVLPPNTTIQKDAVLAIQKSATVFVNYLASQYGTFSFPPSGISIS